MPNPFLFFHGECELPSNIIIKLDDPSRFIRFHQTLRLPSSDPPMAASVVLFFFFLLLTQNLADPPLFHDFDVFVEYVTDSHNDTTEKEQADNGETSNDGEGNPVCSRRVVVCEIRDRDREVGRHEGDGQEEHTELG